MGIYQKLATATTGIALSLIAIESNSAKAATITYDFTVDIVESELLNNNLLISGFFSYDDSTIQGTGSETIPVILATHITRSKNFPDSPGFIITSDDLYGGGAPVFRNQANVLLENRMFNGFQWDLGIRRFEFNINNEEYNNLYFASRPCIDPIELFCRSTGIVSYTLREEPAASVPESRGITGILLLGLGLILKKNRHFCKAS
ncbi:hypothetical protein H6F98_28415 [Microcoleus sp. FACHB-SPT15]|uniref:hypothetical protein n=1 Tax=Microcoleus sp. FACHB-SPT15 TaxID=2692830 RepID=UPI00177A8BD1|nr:hypothetical protein [Microcoleus sp. FACHB-SPT15]MBD1809351.1 hypothetical protein [Microcoleus sp. FACHB-SPT15]